MEKYSELREAPALRIIDRLRVAALGDVNMIGWVLLHRIAQRLRSRG